MHKQDVISALGGTARVARMLGITSQAVSMWPAILSSRQEHELIGAALKFGELDAIVHLIGQLPAPQEAA